MDDATDEPRTSRPRRAAALVLSVAVGSFFVYAGAAKVANPASFRPMLQAVLGGGDATLVPAGYAVVAVDVGLGLLLVLNLGRRAWPFGATLAVLALYTLALTQVDLDEIACGCAGLGGVLNDYPYARNAVLAAACAAGMLLARRRVTASGGGRGTAAGSPP